MYHEKCFTLRWLLLQDKPAAIAPKETIAASFVSFLGGQKKGGGTQNIRNPANFMDCFTFRLSVCFTIIDVFAPIDHFLF